MKLPPRKESVWKSPEKPTDIIENFCRCEMLGGEKCSDCSIGKIIMKAEEYSAAKEKKESPKRCQTT